jgi:catechol 2,3-dioxygenase-like lactoylglutathione lyase family enzyme
MGKDLAKIGPIKGEAAWTQEQRCGVCFMPTINDQRVFLPTKDFARSIDFYSRLGWQVRFRDENLALMELGASRIFLQKYYQQIWADNTMVHLVVDDAVAWHEVVARVKQEGGFDEVKIRRPQREDEDYGALALHVIDPAGVLLHFAQMDK